MKHKNKRRIRLYAATLSFILSILLMSLSFYIAYEKAYYEAIRLLQTYSEKTTGNIAHFIKPLEKILRDMEQLQNPCSQEAQQQLQHITFNNPDIALAFVTKDNQSCSNAGKRKSTVKYIKHDDSLLLTGPVSLDSFNEPAYILSHLRNGYRYGIVLTDASIRELLPYKLSDFMFSAIISSKTGHVFIHKGAYSKPLKVSFLQDEIQFNNHFRDKLKRYFILSPLNHFKNLYLYMAIPNNWIWVQISIHLFSIITIGVILCMIAIFFIIVFAKRHVSLKTAIANALKESEFIPHYQPVVDLNKDITTGVECLIRWQPGNEPMIMPDTFMPTAESTGLIKPITDALLLKVFEEMGDYLKAHPHFHIGINLTPHHFLDDSILKLALSLCEKYEVKTTQLIFELTEQNLIEEDNTKAVNIMKAMREQGFALALDDFGTGYSSMNYLQRFPLDYLKMDKQYVTAIGSGAVTEGIAESMISMGKRLELKIIAEGIETIPQRDYLKERGVDYGQGWFYSKALSKEDLLHYLDKEQEQ